MATAAPAPQGAPRPTARYVVLATAAAPKVKEYSALLAKYGIEVAQGDPSVWTDPEGQAAAFADPKCIAVLRDQGQLLAGGSGDVPASQTDLGIARSVVSLRGKPRSGEEFHYEETLLGFVDPARRRPESASAFGWDDVFVNLSTGRTLFDNEGGKKSSRDAVVSRFIEKFVHYKQRVDLQHAADLTHVKETIDFSFDPARFVEKHPLLSKALTIPGYGCVLKQVLSEGLTFRSASNRREKNYWFPGLNAGIPLVPKRDPVHEATFMAHDFGHFLLPDLIFTGSPLSCSPAGRRLYIAFRMLSEAVTMVLADMLFVEGLRKIHGVAYSWADRKIYPLLAATMAHTGEQLLVRVEGTESAAGETAGVAAAAPSGGSGEAAAAAPAADTAAESADEWQLNVPLLKRLLHANAAFCLRGDEALWRGLMGCDTNPDAAAAFQTYKTKFAPFFVADYVWTAKNYEGMAAEAVAFREWWAASGHLAKTVSLHTLDSYAERVLGPAAMGAGNDGFVESLFEAAWGDALAPQLARKLSDATLAPQPTRFYRAFTRYLLGQAAIFAKHPGCHLTAPVRDALHAAHATLAASQTITDGDVTRLRGVYNVYVSELVHQLRITADDAAVFKEVYPLFEPFFVTYDADPASYDALPRVYAEVFAPTAAGGSSMAAP